MAKRHQSGSQVFMGTPSAEPNHGCCRDWDAAVGVLNPKTLPRQLPDAVRDLLLIA